MRRAVRMQVDDDGQGFVVAQLDRAQNVGEQPFELCPRERQQRPGIDRKAHEIDAGGAQRGEIAAHRDRAAGLERRPVVVGAGRRKLARQGEPRPQVHAATQARSAGLRATDGWHRKGAEARDDTTPAEHGQACHADGSGATGKDFCGSSR